ncbi:MAG: EamA family transporter [Candidatus Melainabacteria bacterium]|nr:EamA family transporter [Candidatus Melainabacteria bacterium]
MNPLHFALALSIVVVWGFNFVVVKTGLVDIPPLLLCVLRFFLTSIPAVFFVKFPSTSVKQVFYYGMTIFASHFAFLFMGMYLGVTPGLASLVQQSQVFFTILLAVLFLNEKLHRWHILGGLTAFLGIGVVGANLGGSVTGTGLFLVLAGGFCWGMGNIVSKKIGNVNMISLIVWSSLFAWPPLLIVSYLLEGREQIVHSLQNLSWVSFGSVAYITFLSTLFGYGIWSWLLQRYPLSTIVPFTLMVPIAAMASSSLVFGETLDSWKVLAGTLVISGLCINLLGSRFATKKAPV